MSGAGKSTLVREVAQRGYPSVDTDYDGWTLPDGLWDEPRMDALLASAPTVLVSGTVANQGRFYAGFHHIVLLTAPVEVLMARVRARTTNDYGKTPEQEAEILGYVRDVEPRLRAGATTVMDGTRTVRDLADELVALLAGP